MDVRLSIDDFGTGYSSLAYLHRFPVDTLKIDRSFVQAITSGQGSAAIVHVISTLATILNMDAIAEGV
jgi:EAL domain-containing protein (putative c-di-GMP-specific phosphodiesterase class I)